MSNLTQSPAPGAVTNSTVSQQSMPQWYTDFLQQMMARAGDVGARGFQQYTGQRVAGFSPMQEQAFRTLQGNVGDWRAPLTQAQGALNQIMPGVNQATQAANDAVAGPAAQWNSQTAQQYMSPYTSGVVDEIARLGTRNFNENLAPGVNSAFVGSGQFGSGRNAKILGNTARDVQADITGQQARALESGYGTAANIFGADATRAQNQGQLQASTALQGGQLGVQGGIGTAGALNQIAGSTQTMGQNDVNALTTAGNQQQQQQQTGLNVAYQNFQDQNGFDMGVLNQMRQLMQGMQLPTGNTTASNNQSGPWGASPADWLAMINTMPRN